MIKIPKFPKIPAGIRLPLLAAFTVLLIAAAALAAIAAIQTYRHRPAVSVLLEALVDQNTRAELENALGDYNSSQKRFRATLLPEASSNQADLFLGPYKEGELVWRSQGWRLWARLETLAGMEGSLRRQIILPLRKQGLDEKDFEALLADSQGQGLAPLIIPTSQGLHSSVLELYLGKLEAEPGKTMASWTAKGWLRAVPDQRAAVEAIRKGKAVFIIGDDSMAASLGISSDSHTESFALPTSAGARGAWVIGRADGFAFPRKGGPKAGAVDLVTYLTSKGLTRRFAQRLPGTYYSWTELPPRGRLPIIAGPTEFLDPGR